MIKHLINFYRKNRLRIAYAVMTLVLVSPYIDIAIAAIRGNDFQWSMRTLILAALPLFILFLLNDWRGETDQRLSKIESGLYDREPETFRRFSSMEEALANDIKKIASAGEDVSIKVISVSAKFSFPFLKRVMTTILNDYKKAGVVSIEIASSRAEKLEAWQLPDWVDDCKTTVSKARRFHADHSDQMKLKNMSFKFYQYDNLPHWHGVMINDKILYQGRTEWFKDGDDLRWQLRVGEVEYRRFERTDLYGGSVRLDRFILWFDRYRERSESESWSLFSELPADAELKNKHEAQGESI